MGFDVTFIKRVYRTSIGVWLFGLLICSLFGSAKNAIGITIGFAISLGSMRLLEELVTRLISPDNSAKSRGAVRKVIAGSLVKYLVIGAALWLSIRFQVASPWGLAVGIGIPQAVIFLKALGIFFSAGPETK